MKARTNHTTPAERPTSRTRPAASGTRHPNAPLLQRCACGGRCPRCRDADELTLQPRLRITPPGDRYEREAERTADAVLRSSAAPHTPPRISPLLQRHADHDAAHPPSTLAADLRRLRGRGRALPEAERRYFEPRFGRDFSDVRLHTGSTANRLAGSVSAHAFASGRDVVFAAGQYRPGTATGRRLLAHELTHVVQQGSAARAVQRQSTSVGNVPDEYVVDDPGWDVNDPKWDVGRYKYPEAPYGTYSEQRIEDIYFERGSSRLTPRGADKVFALTHKYSGRQLTLYGFVSEDEQLEFGDALAVDRAEAVRATFDSVKGKGTPSPGVESRPDESLGVIKYRTRRKVEAVPEDGVSTTLKCDKGALRTLPMDAGSRARKALKGVLTEAQFDRDIRITLGAFDRAIGYLRTARTRLARGMVRGALAGNQTTASPLAPARDPVVDAVLAAQFGDPAKGPDVLEGLGKLLTYLEARVAGGTPHDILRGFRCDGACGAGALAQNLGVTIKLCDSFFGALRFNAYSNDVDDQRAFLILHEGAHGAIDATDYAYEGFRLYPFIHAVPDTALKNTDSYVGLIACLAGFDFACVPTYPSLPVEGIIDSADAEKALADVAWLQTWLLMSWQAAAGAYSELNRSRDRDTRLDVEDDDVKRFITHFRLPRSARAPATMDEQVHAAGVFDRYRRMEIATRVPLRIARTSFSRTWTFRTSPTDGPRLQLDPAYFKLGRRDRVETLLELIVEDYPDIDPAFRDAYVGFTLAVVNDDLSDLPKPTGAPSSGP